MVGSGREPMTAGAAQEGMNGGRQAGDQAEDASPATAANAPPDYRPGSRRWRSSRGPDRPGRSGARSDPTRPGRARGSPPESPTMSIPTLRVFVSSTWKDLQPERQAAEQVVHRLRAAQ